MLKYIVVDYRMPLEMKEKLKKYGVPIINTAPNKNLDEGIKGHPDMLIHPTKEGEIICDKENKEVYHLLFEGNMIPSTRKIGKKYPSNIGLNGVAIGNYFIHNLKYTDPTLLEYYKRKNFHCIDVKQGYTKCNILHGDDFIITSDQSIYHATKNHIDTLLIHHKQIKLKGYNYGFIGGASGFINGEVIFTGRLNEHSSQKEILLFLEERNIPYFYLSQRPIEDYGSILPIYEKAIVKK